MGWTAQSAQRLGSVSAPGTSVLAPCVMLVHSDSLDCFCFGSVCCHPAPLHSSEPTYSGGPGTGVSCCRRPWAPSSSGTCTPSR